jgi:ABC-2 type transport system ATP-binding protein
MNTKAISMKNVTKKYGKNLALDSVDLELDKGMILGMIGSNGAGKTTLIKCLLGLTKPDEGEISVFGDPASNLSVATKHKIGYVPQSIVGFSWMKVKDLMEYTGAFYDNWDEKIIESMIDEWGLDPYAKIGTLSTGERQKVAIIQAMGHDPDLYVLDEPVASLDPSARRAFIKKIIELNAEQEKTVLFSTHITSDMERMAAEIAFIKNGKILFRRDLGELKEKVVKLKIHSPVPLPDVLPIKNIISIERNTKDAVVTIDGYEEGLIEKIERSLNASVFVENMNLEDIFMEMIK